MTDRPGSDPAAASGASVTERVGLVIVSHSAKIAEGVVELAGQMAGGTRIIPAGGTDDGRIGTSFELVQEAIAAADGGAGVVVLCDLGSAILTAETALDLLADDLRTRVRIADAPIVEGSVAAAVAAETGQDLTSVVVAAESASGRPAEPDAEPVSGQREPASSGEAGASGGVPVGPDQPGSPSVGTAVIRNREGLHARPAAEFVKLAHTFDASVTVNGVDAKSLLRIMSLGLTAGSTVTLEATGPDGAASVAALAALVESGFGE